MSQNVQIGISKFHGIWTLALTDVVPLKGVHAMVLQMSIVHW